MRLHLILSVSRNGKKKERRRRDHDFAHSLYIIHELFTKV